MTWIKQKPYFTGEPNRRYRAEDQNRGPHKSGGKKTGTEYVKKGVCVCVQTSGIHICKGAEGGANSASTGRGVGQQRKNMRWREQRQWLIHERSHVLNFLRSREEWVSYSPPQSPQAKRLCSTPAMVNHSSASSFFCETNEAQLCPNQGHCKRWSFQGGEGYSPQRGTAGRGGAR